MGSHFLIKTPAAPTWILGVRYDLIDVDVDVAEGLR